MRLSFIVTTLLGVGFVASCSDPSDKTAAQEFWDWFTPKSENYARLYTWEQREKETGSPDSRPSGIAMKEISAQLQKIHPAFSPFLGGGKDDEKRNFIVSVSGDSSLFGEVDNFIKNAPENDHWNFIALKPRTLISPGTVIQTGDSTIPLDNARFTFEQNSSGLADLVVYLHPEFDSTIPRVDGFVKTLCVDMIGERLAGTALGDVVVKKLTEVPDDALPFLKLGDTLDSMSPLRSAS